MLVLHTGYLDRIIFRAKRKEAATILIQCMVRMWLARKTYLFLRKAIIRIQRHARIFLAQKQGAVYFEANRSAIIQVHFNYFSQARLLLCILLF